MPSVCQGRIERLDVVSERLGDRAGALDGARAERVEHGVGASAAPAW